MASDALTDLQDRLGHRIEMADQVALAQDMQALDTVQQTLADLASLFGSMAIRTSADQPLISDDLLESIQQTSLRDRLSGRGRTTSDPSVELF
ncbi:hypothetical protein [Jannaschia donghaensis]|nr:hypothetical protein [Jannaschia donghaensis]